MSNQKSRKQYIQESKEPLDVCVWHITGECYTSGLRESLKKEKYDGLVCKCFAYVPNEYILEKRNK